MVRLKAACSLAFKKHLKTVYFHSYSPLNSIIWGIRKEEADDEGTIYQNKIWPGRVHPNPLAELFCE